MGKIIGYLKDRNGRKYKIEFVDNGLLHSNSYRILDDSNYSLIERNSKEKAIRELESRVGPVRED